MTKRRENHKSQEEIDRIDAVTFLVETLTLVATAMPPGPNQAEAIDKAKWSLMAIGVEEEEIFEAIQRVTSGMN